MADHSIKKLFEANGVMSGTGDPVGVELVSKDGRVLESHEVDITEVGELVTRIVHAGLDTGQFVRVRNI